MCGIAGLWVKRGNIDPAERAGRMAAVLRHRGPDGQGRWSDGPVGLGHARLAVIDLTPSASQPMADAEGRAAIAFNGEVYNFRELRAELEAAGARFVSHSDTEVVLQGYLRWGTGIVKRLRGMFALAIYDRRKRQMILARDRVGKKPLYYYDGADLFAFGSEIKAILVNPEVARRANLSCIHDYLTLQYTPGPETAFENIHRVPPAHIMIVEADGTRRLERYWQLPHPTAARKRSGADLGAEFMALLDDAVRVRMVADVPVGALLSGGVDSSAVVALMARQGVGTVKTFSVGFSEPNYDETVYAKQVADHIGVEHHVLHLGPDCTDILPKLSWHYGEPFADPSAIATTLVSEFARKHVTVVLNGDGGDESMLGYPRYMTALGWGRRARQRDQRLAALALRALPERFHSSRVGRKLHYLAAQLDDRPSRRYATAIAYFQENEKPDAYGEALRPFLARSSLDVLEPYFTDIPSPAAGAAWADLHTYLPDDLLVKVDVASMAHGLEARSPLLDHHLMEWAAKLPPEQKMTDTETKALFKAAIAPYLPHEAVYRPKMGFGVPVELWLRGPLKPLAYDLLTSDRFRARKLVRPEWIDWLLETNSEGRATLWHRIWALMVLEMWYRTWIDPATPPV